MDDRAELRRNALRALARLLLIAGGLLTLYLMLPLRGDRWWLSALVGLAAIAAIVPFTARRVAAVRSASAPTLVAAEALVLVFAMLVLGFSAVYLTIDRDAGQFIGLDTRVDALYFTVTTLSTVGFGDVSASGQAARIAVVVQIIVDFTLLAVAVKTLVAAARTRVTTSLVP